ncbi:MAG: YlbF family regulator [Clostridia bacterium]|nr:YlbF family regulator [Clostridia bacterium]
MTKIIELAHNLGEAIAESKEIADLEAAKAAYETNSALQAKLAEYEADRKLLADEFEKGDDLDQTVVDKMKSRLEELGAEITKDPVCVDFANAQKAMNDLMTSVNDEISFCITGQRPDHCTHDCSTCGGCH